jgi:hypothetical protein
VELMAPQVEPMLVRMEPLLVLAAFALALMETVGRLSLALLRKRG